MTRIEPMTEADIAAVLAIDPDARESNLREELVRTWGRLRVLRSEHLLGYVLFWHVTDEIHLLNVAVDPAERRKGYGRRLVEEVIDFGRSHQAERVLLEVRVSNAAAVALYAALGFEEFNRRKRYYDDGEDAIEMMKLIRS
jgi:ribosomal-protein-alanine N-acetyltransferase